MLIVIVTDREEKREESREQREENEKENEGREKEERTRERERGEERERPRCSGSSRLREYIQKASVYTGKTPECVQHEGVLPIHTETI